MTSSSQERGGESASRDEIWRGNAGGAGYGDSPVESGPSSSGEWTSPRDGRGTGGRYSGPRDQQSWGDRFYGDESWSGEGQGPDYDRGHYGDSRGGRDDEWHNRGSYGGGMTDRGIGGMAERGGGGMDRGWYRGPDRSEREWYRSPDSQQQRLAAREWTPSARRFREEHRPEAESNRRARDPYQDYGAGSGDYFYGGESSARQDKSRRDRGPHYGKGPNGYRRSDTRIEEDVNEALTSDGAIDASEIEVKVDEGTVTLTGTVSDRETKRRAEDCAEECSGVREVQNNLKVSRKNKSEQHQAGEHSDGAKHVSGGGGGAADPHSNSTSGSKQSSTSSRSGTH